MPAKDNGRDGCPSRPLRPLRWPLWGLVGRRIVYGRVVKRGEDQAYRRGREIDRDGQRDGQRGED
jgi:hypothetical protein